MARRGVARRGAARRGAARRGEFSVGAMTPEALGATSERAILLRQQLVVCRHEDPLQATDCAATVRRHDAAALLTAVLRHRAGRGWLLLPICKYLFDELY